MKSVYEKACSGEYLEKYDKKGNLLRTAELFNNSWVVWVYRGIDVSGEYSNDIFKKEIRKYFNK